MFLFCLLFRFKVHIKLKVSVYFLNKFSRLFEINKEEVCTVSCDINENYLRLKLKILEGIVHKFYLYLFTLMLFKTSFEIFEILTNWFCVEYIQWK